MKTIVGAISGSWVMGQGMATVSEIM